MFEWLWRLALGPKANRLHGKVFSIVDDLEKKLGEIGSERDKLSKEREEIERQEGLLTRSASFCNRFIEFAKGDE